MKVTVDDPEPFLLEYGVELQETSREDEKLCLCPFHEDKEPSCGVNISKQVFNCPSCHMTGDLVDLVAGFMNVKRATIMAHVELQSGKDEQEPINQALIIGWHNILIQSKAGLELIRERKGITGRAIKEFMVGIDGDRYTFPVSDKSGAVVNVRKWSPTDKKRKVINMKGRGRRMLYPLSTLSMDTASECCDVVLTEGEAKAVLLRQMHLPGLTPTGGASGWSPEWNTEFKGKRVALIYDVDSAGRRGAAKVCRNLFSQATWVKDVLLPMSTGEHPKGGIEDFVARMGMGRADVVSLIEKAEKWVPDPLRPVRDEDETVYPIPLHQTSLAKYYMKFVETEAVVAAKDTAPYIIPKVSTVTCPRDRDYCFLCPVYNRPEDEVEIVIDERHPAILSLVNIPNDRVNAALKLVAGIPKACEVCRFNVKETQNVEEIKVIPEIRIKADHEEGHHVTRRAFYVGHGLETNVSYKFTSRVVQEPTKQYATLLSYRAEAAVDSLSTFVLTDPDRLRVFRPDTWDVAGIQARLDLIYNDLECNVTRIYHRRSLHIFYDLVYHSLLYLPFQGRVVRGWMEGLCIGDSGQGKSETADKLQHHYQLGEKIDSKGATVAGLLGGMTETSGRWFVNWGVIPLNDRRLVRLEEVKGLATAVIEKLTDMRSSGVADLSKIEKAKTNARTRLLWVSNPRSDQQLASYNFGIYAIKELIGSLEDIRRFDLAVMVASGEVPRDVLNMRDDKRPHAEHVHTSDLCRELVLWAWSRKVEQVHFTPDAVEAILKAAEEMGDKYVSNIPLVESADQRHKIARMAASLAARTFSATEDGQGIVVRACHAQFVHQFLDSQYSSAIFGYLQYSQLIKGDATLRDEEEVAGLVASLPNARDSVRSLLEWTGFSLSDWMDVTEHDKDQARVAVSLLVRKNAIRRGRAGLYFKTPAFISLLRKLEMTKGLSTESAEDKLKRNEF